jgi:hypothetical protein
MAPVSSIGPIFPVTAIITVIITAVTYGATVATATIMPAIEWAPF